MKFTVSQLVLQNVRNRSIYFSFNVSSKIEVHLVWWLHVWSILLKDSDLSVVVRDIDFPDFIKVVAEDKAKHHPPVFFLNIQTENDHEKD